MWQPLPQKRPITLSGSQIFLITLIVKRGSQECGNLIDTVYTAYQIPNLRMPSWIVRRGHTELRPLDHVNDSDYAASPNMFGETFV